jgi:hypothetical protein
MRRLCLPMLCDARARLIFTQNCAVYPPCSASGGALPFHLPSKLCERTSVAITTNLGKWATLIGDAKATLHCLIALTTAVSSLKPETTASLQGKLSRCSPVEEGEKPALCPSMNRNPQSEVAHFSVKSPAQFRVKTNSRARRRSRKLKSLKLWK